MPKKSYIPRPSYSHATGEIRKGNKPVYTEARMVHHGRYWARVQTLLRYYLEIRGHGAQSEIALALGMTDSQIHRYSCPVCEHDQEPRFSTGMAILCYITESLYRPIIDDELAARKPRKKR